MEPTPARRQGILRTKPIEAILAAQDDELLTESGTNHLKRALGVRDLMGFGIGMVIGTGIFTLTGLEAKNHAGPAVTLSFIIAGVVALFAAFCYAEMASAVPTAGSSYTYAYATLGEVFAWIIGWDLVLEFALGAAVVARSWSGYVGNLFHLPTSMFGETSVVNVGAIIVTLLLGYVVLVGVKESARVTNLLVFIKVAVCVFVVVVGVFFIKGANYHPFIPPSQPSTGGSGAGLEQPLSQALFGLTPSAFGIAGVMSAAAVVFFSYSGFELVANMGEETKNPKRDMPRGLFGTLAICTLLYVAVCIVITGMVHYDKISESAPIAAAFADRGLGWASILISAAAIAGLTSVFLTDLTGMTRIGYAMARDGLLPASFAAVHPKWRTPHRITIATLVAVAVFGGLVPLRALADMVSIGTLFAFVVVSIAVPVLRRTRPDLERSFTVPLSPVLPIISALLCAYLMTNLTLATWLRFLLWMAIGFVVYFVWGRRNAARTHDWDAAQPAPRG